MRPTELRHPAASLAVDAGVPLDQVSDLLGHKDMRMVTQTYRHKVRPTVGTGSAAMLDQLLVFPSASGRVLDPANVRRTMRRVCESNGLPVLTPNELRHTCASLLVDAGVPLHVVADRLGHADTRQLEQTYRHRIRPVVAGGVSEMDLLLLSGT